MRREGLTLPILRPALPEVRTAATTPDATHKPKQRLSKQLSMCETPRDVAWERRRRQMIMIQEKKLLHKGVSDNLSEQTKLTDEDLNELKGSIELGFGFNEEAGQKLCNTLPALDLYFAVNRQLSPLPSPSSSRSSSASAQFASYAGLFCTAKTDWIPENQTHKLRHRRTELTPILKTHFKNMAPDASTALAAREKVQQFLNAACTGNLDFLKKVAQQLDEGKGLTKTVESIKDANKRGALHFAAREGQTEICRYLLEELKLDADTKDEAGDTPLVHAARQGQIATAKYLLDHGADPNIASELGATALHHAAGTGEIELLKELLSRGVPVDSQSESGTPLIWAAGHDQKEAVEVLLQHNADPNAETEDNITPLLSSVAAGSLASLELLVKAGAKANVFAGGATPLHIAADIGDLELINCLLKAGADPNQKDEEGNRPLEVAAARENRKVVETLFPLTTKPDSVSDWTVDGILAHMESNKELGREENSSKAKSGTEIKKDLPEVSPEAKEKAAEAKARGQDAFHRKDFQMAIDAYTQAIDFDPTDHTLFSNRSLCWLRLGQAEHALSDAKACRELKPDWPKGCFREGAALRLLQRFDEAANAFYEGVLLSPESKELIDAFREAVDAGRKFHGKDKIEAKS
ncbi:unnamed protein product [Thlaspi arvense]|uniref:Serine/threonine-protein kinase BSK1-like TPR repeats domain-containing protein n=1 Tax=Thlaspi arvense TaxID=13288 RepID=A0AAU9S2C4_THLAR|nr:unnamed protein product [Thlaspi arvense]